LSDGVLYKFNATAPSESQSRKFNASSSSDGQIKHANATTWYQNYPMEQVYEKYFNVEWTHAYNGSGVKLDQTTWGDHPRAGDSIGFIGLWGFDNTDMKNFVSGGEIQEIKVEVRFDDPSHAGNPSLKFGVHIYKSKPSSSSWDDINNLYVTSSTFNQTGSDFSRWITLPNAAWLNGNMGGVAVWAASNTAANSARFAGKTSSHSLNSFNTRLYIKVLR
jgi:hypothetical protein